MTSTIYLDKTYSTTRLLTQEIPEIPNSPEDKFETFLFIPEGENRKGEGGLRTKGYFKKTYDDKPLISIITVVYNGEKYLEETIQSVLNQTYDNVEYIIIDGGSTDGTVDIIKKYEDQIDYWVSEKDSGIYDAMNKGIVLSSGDWINFMNAGDTFYNSQVIDEVFKNQKVLNSIIYGKANVINSNYNTSFSLGGEVLFTDFNFNMPICHQSIFHPNEAFTNIGLFDTTFKIIADHAWFLKAMVNGYNIEFVNVHVSNYLMDGYSTQNQLLLLKEKYRLSKMYFTNRYIKNKFTYGKNIVKKYISLKLSNTTIYKYLRKKKYENKK